MSAEPRALHPVIRPLEAGDLDAVIAIEEAAYPFPWTRGIFAECLRVGYGCLGVFMDGRLAGYVIFNWGAGESHLLNLCVHPERQGRGLGGLLLSQALERVRAMGCTAMFLEVRPSNPEAAGLYEKQGFRVVGRRPDYYRSSEGREDAIVMRLDFDDDPGGELAAD
ncbi:MAG: ribosomal protein S18-alanine N-acetyltransferase [Xanthomonadales bacterium]|jgi:ribosomal-protein-alanine N-acetyltransferase|nr:ribosomal protein S18-alanine N-acetyltransferase [Xanthomonadales bacterium]